MKCLTLLIQLILGVMSVIYLKTHGVSTNTALTQSVIVSVQYLQLKNISLILHIAFDITQMVSLFQSIDSISYVCVNVLTNVIYMQARSWHSYKCKTQHDLLNMCILYKHAYQIMNKQFHTCVPTFRPKIACFIFFLNMLMFDFKFFIHLEATMQVKVQF